MTEFDTVFRSLRVVTPAGVMPAAVGVRDGRIRAVAGHGARLRARCETDLGGTALLPGAVDLGTGVHTPGLELAEAYRRTARAALAGGATTLVVSPAPGRPAVTRADDLQVHLRASADSPVSVYLMGGVHPGSGPLDLTDLRAAGAVAFQCSLSDGGEPGMAGLEESRLRKAMAEIAALDAPLLVHAEDPVELGPALTGQRPPVAERRGLERVVAAARAVGTRTHVSPFTAAECAALLAAARSIGVGVSAQTCPHYLCLPTELLEPGSPAHAFRPPLRSDANRRALWSALLEENSAITTVSSGHLPARGLSTLEWSLPALWTAAARRGLGLHRLARWTAQGPAELLGLVGKGRIEVGCDADLVAFSAEEEMTVPRSDPGPYAGRTIAGKVGPVWVSGQRVR